jgi:hypothetical protein
MCEPTTAMLVLTAASTAMQVSAQQQAASAQEAANQRQYQNTMRAYAANVNQTNAEHMQQREGAMQKLEENNMQARAAASTAQVSAGESGISGMSVDALLADLGNRQQRFNSAVTTNYQNAEVAINNQRENIGIDAASQINSLKTPAMPDYAGAALRIGTAAYDYYNPRISDRRVR